MNLSTFLFESIVLFLSLVCSVSGLNPKVAIANGTLQGRYLQEYHQDVFLGVPYAQPPVGQLRFEKAQPINETWNGIRDATTYSAGCAQYSVS
jgi:carboxylesterase type B